ncbi:MAG: PIN domain-containing protein [Alphaproteobacteria bacterium]|nr:PIN domain-containing protein [Alphaproteobacteria bacterium]
MIAVDTSSFVAFLEGGKGVDINLISGAIEDGTLRFPGPVLTELLSYPVAGPKLTSAIEDIPVLELPEGFWERAGATRRKVLAKGFKARIADALIAQCCLDHGLQLITRDKDFRHFADYCGLMLIGAS